MDRILLAGALALAQLGAAAQEDAVVVTATRAPQPSLQVPASVDRIEADEIREGRPQVNLSESLGRVPGIVVQNRQNYAQDLQISSRAKAPGTVPSPTASTWSTCGRAPTARRPG